MHGQTKISPKSWLAFDLNVLRRLTFSSVALPFTDQSSLGAYLKRWNVRVAANDPLRSAFTRSIANISNSTESLSPAEIETVLEDAYVPGYRLSNLALTNWFSETDAWWFDNVRNNIEKLERPMSQAIASSVVLATGDYVLAFNTETRELRQPLSNVFRRLVSIQTPPYNNGQNNTSDNKIPDDFIAETPSDLMFLRLPHPHAQTERTHLGRAAWREEWLRGGSDFLGRTRIKPSRKTGSGNRNKITISALLEETLRRASHNKKWAIAHVEDGFIQTQDIADTIGKIRRVDTVYTKDFTELTGTKAVIITA